MTVPYPLVLSVRPVVRLKGVRKMAAAFSLGPCLLVGIPPYELGAAAASSGPAPLRTAIGAGLYAGYRT